MKSRIVNSNNVLVYRMHRCLQYTINFGTHLLSGEAKKYHLAVLVVSLSTSHDQNIKNLPENKHKGTTKKLIYIYHFSNNSSIHI